MLYTQLLFTALAFITMAVLSYVFMSSIVRESLVRNSESILDFSEERLSSSLLEPRGLLYGLSETMRGMVLRGDSQRALQDYVNNVSDFISLGGRYTSNSRVFYGYFETLPGGPVFLHGDNWVPPDAYKPTEQSWFTQAVRSSGRLVETVPHINAYDEIVFFYTVALMDDSGRRLGVVCLEMHISSIGQDIVNTALNQGGYGMLLNQDLLLIAHPNTDFVGRNMSDPIVPVHIFTDELESGVEVSERSVSSFRGEPAVAFFRELPNGWYLGLVAPKEKYYSSMGYMAAVLGILAVVLAGALMTILIRIDAAKDKSDAESRQKSTFLANMSHEIRTPINAIIGMTVIGKNTAELERKDYCFGKIDDASRHLLGIINDILDMSKIEADKFELSPEEFRFDELIRRVENVISFSMEQKRQRFTTAIDEKIPAVLVGDDQRLAQVMINLLSNAVKFTPEGGSIKLSARLEAEADGLCTVVVEVSDTGIGIAREHLSKLFKSFEQEDSGTSRKYGGTGLGLVISKNIAEMMGGTIGVNSVSGEGSTFTFSFIASRVAESSASPDTLPGSGEEASVLPGEFSGLRILLAEDVEINREIVLIFMEETGAEIDCAENGIEVLKKFDENPEKYDLVFMDVQMPEMDGLEATRKLRERGAKVPIIAMTANVFKDDVEKCLAAGMNGHIGKPLDMNEVLKTVRKYNNK